MGKDVRIGKLLYFDNGRPNDTLGSALHDLIIELMDYGGTSASDVVQVLCETNPALVRRFDIERIRRRASRMLIRDRAALAVKLRSVFGDFNQRYFKSALPEYEIRIRYDIDSVVLRDHRFPPLSLGRIDFERRMIWIRVAMSETMISTLLHEMAHAATNGEHDEEWKQEMIGLHAAGAPFDWTESWIWNEGGQISRL